MDWHPLDPEYRKDESKSMGNDITQSKTQTTVHHLASIANALSDEAQACPRTTITYNEDSMVLTIEGTGRDARISGLDPYSESAEVIEALSAALRKYGFEATTTVDGVPDGICRIGDCEEFFSKQDYDLRQTHNGRWMDQKLTADILQFVADCVMQYAEEHPDKPFSATDIWHSDYAQEYIDAFGKPDLNDSSAKREYDKLFGQPLRMLAAAGVLKEGMSGNTKVYTIAAADVLEFISLSLRNANDFIAEYSERTLRASGLGKQLDRFLKKEDAPSLAELRQAFIALETQYTGIKEALEPRRIFPKVANSVAYRHKTHGIIRGRLSQDIIQMNDILYNRVNFRDQRAGKLKGMTRITHQAGAPSRVEQMKNEKLLRYRSDVAKKELKAYNRRSNKGRPEYLGDCLPGETAQQAHHILMRSQYPELGYYPENLIMLTPTQHFSHAHPDNNTGMVDPAYQKVLMLAKVSSVEKSIRRDGNDSPYAFDRLREVVATVIDDDAVRGVEDGDYDALRNAITEIQGVT